MLIVLLMLVALASPYSASSSRNWKESDNGMIRWDTDCDFAGSDIEQKTSSEAECRTSCLRNSECSHFTFRVDFGNTCFMKKVSRNQGEVERPGAVCGFVISRKEVSSKTFCPWKVSSEEVLVRWNNDCDFIGGDIEQKENILDTECEKLCLGNGLCTHFTYSGNTCLMKRMTENARPYKFRGAVCGWIATRIESRTCQWKKSDNGLVSWDKDCDFFGSDIEQQTSSDTECRSLCLRNALCTHFTYSGNTCFMKRMPGDSRETEVTGAACGFVVSRLDSTLPTATTGPATVRPPTSCKWKEGGVDGLIRWANNCDFSGDDIGSVPSTAEQCGERCFENARCTHFSHKRSTCFFKEDDDWKNQQTADGQAICGWIVGRSEQHLWGC